MKIAPTLTTERLTLRMHRPEDFDAYADLFTSDRAQHLGRTSDRETAWSHFCVDVAGWPLHGAGAWAIEQTQSGAFVGQVSIAKRRHDTEVELGWFVFAPYEGQGIAAEAATAARAWGYGTLGLKTLVSYIDPENSRSIALAERLGACLDAAAIAPKDRDLVYRHPKPEVRR